MPSSLLGRLTAMDSVVRVGYEAYAERARPREIPVVVLEAVL